MEPGHIRLKIYCAGPMRAGGKYVGRFHEMVRIVEALGHDALSELSSTVEWGELKGLTRGADGGSLADAAGTVRRRAYAGKTATRARSEIRVAVEDAYIYARDIHWLDTADALVAEVSGPSLGVGYEISYALHERRIPVLCLLHREVGSFSAMIGGNCSPLLALERYCSRPEMRGVIRQFLQNVRGRTASSP
jgi:hypothetical protein